MRTHCFSASARPRSWGAAMFMGLIVTLMMLGWPVSFAYATEGHAPAAREEAKPNDKAQAKEGDQPDARKADDQKKREDSRDKSPRKPEGDSRLKLTKEQLATGFEIIEQLQPRLAARIRAAREKHPDHVERMIAEQWPRLYRLAELKKDDPELFKLTMVDVRLTRESFEATRRVQKAQRDGEAAEIQATQAKLHSIIDQQFQVRQQMREHELKKVEAQAARLRQDLEKRLSERDKLIDQRVQELLSAKSEGDGEM
ncbi:MAG: hypothetical protein WD042_00395 [Phycisphaeraceae bacterium]